MSEIQSNDQLREHYRPVNERAERKVINQLDVHCRHFINLSPFLVIGTSDPQGHGDVSPRGGEPGFVRVIDDVTIAMPDSPGNNRLDTISNVVAHPEVALIFFVPGVDETLRINGTATVSSDAELCQSFDLRGRHPASVMLVNIRETYLHCAKALMRSKLWQPEATISRDTLPSMGQMMKDQIGLSGPAESQQEMVAKYTEDL